MAQPLSRLLFRRFLSPNIPPIRSSVLRSRPAFNNNTPRTFRRPVAGGPRRVEEKITFAPFLAILVIGSGIYILMVNTRAEAAAEAAMPQIPGPKKDIPVFNKDDVTVLFVLGGPGAGKGTQCANLVRDYNFTHLSAGDLLRAEQQRPGSQFGSLINDYIKEGKIVPMEVTVQLLENAMTESLTRQESKKGNFLIDGFPRQMDQALKFEETVCPARFVLFFDCPEDEMEKRLLNRGKSSGRADDNAESIKKRFRTFVETSMPVVDYFEKQGRVVKVTANKGPDEVYDDVKKRILGKI